MADDVTLTLGGAIYGGWTEVEIASGIDAVAASFRISGTERWPGHPDRWSIEAGAAVSVAIGGTTVLTGYVDRLECALGADQHGITVSGRSKTGDLVDCSAVSVPGSWAGKSLEAIAGELAAPFGISVSAEASTAPVFKKFAIQQGESVFDAIARMLRMRGLIATTGEDGNLRLLSPAPGAAGVTLMEGRDFFAARASHDVSDRFSLYITKGQAAGDDYANGSAVAGPRGQATDPAVTRNRPLVVMAEDQATATSLQQRAAWEATTRAAKAQEATLSVPGWRRSDGALWDPGQLVQLTAPSLWIDHGMMVVEVRFRLSSQGKIAEIRFGRPEAYTRLALPEDAKESSIRKEAATATLGRRR